MIANKQNKVGVFFGKARNKNQTDSKTEMETEFEFFVSVEKRKLNPNCFYRLLCAVQLFRDINI